MGPLDNFDRDNHKILRKLSQQVYLITIPEYCLMSSTIEVEGKILTYRLVHCFKKHMSKIHISLYLKYQMWQFKGYMIITWCFDVFGYTKNTVTGQYSDL